MQSGHVELLQIQRERGLPFERVMSIELIINKGIAGDCHALGGEKQIAIISKEAKYRLENQEIDGLCFQRFKENMVVEGIEFDLLKTGDVLTTKHVMIEITSYTKRCHKECLVRQKKVCTLKSQIIFGKVLQSGNIMLGENIAVHVP